ncbi:MAG: protein transporter tim10 [Cirrosporium novae-zelandiae]|nr:MAG: protein transporter tim10 [Cirrosporium novae-zelandiae]
MSFLFGGKPQLTSEQKIAAAEAEIEMAHATYQAMSDACTKKCIPPEHREGELNKGESVCLDRCVSKFFEVYQKMGQKMQQQQSAAMGGLGGL